MRELTQSLHQFSAQFSLLRYAPELIALVTVMFFVHRAQLLRRLK